MLRALFCLGWAVLFSSGVSHARENFPPKVQQAVRQVLHGQALETLKSALEMYNQPAARTAKFREAVASLKLSSADQALLLEVGGASEKELPSAAWRDGEIVIAESGIELVIGAHELAEQFVRINKRKYRWDRKHSVRENLGLYDRMFTSAKSASFSIFSEAHAAAGDVPFKIKAAGLQIYFMVGSLSDPSQLLVRLNEKVKTLLADCEAADPKGQTMDEFFFQIFRGMDEAGKSRVKPILFRNCADLEKYSRVAVASSNQGPVFPKLPPDLCKNLARLAACMRKANPPDPKKINEAKEKGVKPDPEEWNETVKSEGASAEPAKP